MYSVALATSVIAAVFHTAPNQMDAQRNQVTTTISSSQSAASKQTADISAKRQCVRGADPNTSMAPINGQCSIFHPTGKTPPLPPLGIPSPTQVGIPGAPLANPHLFGDWGGLRTTLSDMGITPTVQYVGEIAHNLNGGIGRKTAYADQFALGATFDVQKLFGGPPTGKFQLTFIKRDGHSVSTTAHLNLLQFSQEIYGRGTIWRLSQAWYQQSFGNFEAKFGRLGVSEDFASARCDFESLYLCGAPVGHIAYEAWFGSPVSQWGTRLRYKAGALGFAQIGLYQVNQINISRGFDLGINGGSGVLAPVELDWTPVFDGGLPGIYKIGAFYTNADAADILTREPGAVPPLPGTANRLYDRFGFYGNLRQQLIRPRDDGSHGLSMFVNAVQIDSRTSLQKSKFAIGFNYTGLIPDRPMDDVGLGVGRGEINPRVSDYQRQTGRSVQTSEYTVELNYGWEVVTGLVVRPNIQYTINPSALEDRSNVFVLGLKTVVAL